MTVVVYLGYFMESGMLKQNQAARTRQPLGCVINPQSVVVPLDENARSSRRGHRTARARAVKPRKDPGRHGASYLSRRLAHQTPQHAKILLILIGGEIEIRRHADQFLF